MLTAITWTACSLFIHWDSVRELPQANLKFKTSVAVLLHPKADDRILFETFSSLKIKSSSVIL